MKLDFDPESNMSWFDFHYSHVNYASGLMRVRKVVRNWYSIPFFRLKLKKSLVLRFRDGRILRINSPSEYFDFWLGIEGRKYLLQTVGMKVSIGKQVVSFRRDGITMRFWFGSNDQLPNVLGLIFEQFGREQYKKLDVEGRNVVDIGASVGDTAIYFALKGARHIYAFEPFPYAFNIAKKNIELNELESKITLLNEGVSGKSGRVKIPEKLMSDASSSMKGFSEGKSVRVTTLKEIVKRFKIKNGALKSDCEGYEYPIFLKADSDTLNSFYQMAIEYQYGYRNLVRKLKDGGFKTQHTMPMYLAKSKMFLGMIYASICR